LHLFIQHTSCALSLNENYDEDVRYDMSVALDRIVPEDKGGRGGKGLYRHDAEGSDDMPVRTVPTYLPQISNPRLPLLSTPSSTLLPYTILILILTPFT
jgi:hypothetical protein